MCGSLNLRLTSHNLGDRKPQAQMELSRPRCRPWTILPKMKTRVGGSGRSGRRGRQYHGWVVVSSGSFDAMRVALGCCRPELLCRRYGLEEGIKWAFATILEEEKRRRKNIKDDTQSNIVVGQKKKNLI